MSRNVTKIRPKKSGRCARCQRKWYLECADCYAIIEYRGQNHNCPCKDSGNIVDPIICGYCDTQDQNSYRDD